MRFDYYFLKSTQQLGSIVAIHLPETPQRFIFFYQNDSIVMISPVGQQPYYVREGKIVDAREPKHKDEEMRR